MDEPHRWVRLFPLDYRGLVYAQRFKKNEVIEVDASKSQKDSRPESFTPVLDSITVGEFVDTDGGTWRRRLPFFDAIADESMCEIQRRQKTERKSLGVFRPMEVTDLKVTSAEKGFAESQRALLNQASLFGDRAGDDHRCRVSRHTGESVEHQASGYRDVEARAATDHRDLDAGVGRLDLLSGTPCHSWPSRITVRSRAGSSRGSAIAPSASSTATIRQPSARCCSTQRSLPVRTQWIHGWRPSPRVSPRASASR